jgi:hypothetical protein
MRHHAQPRSSCKTRPAGPNTRPTLIACLFYFLSQPPSQPPTRPILPARPCIWSSHLTMHARRKPPLDKPSPKKLSPPSPPSVTRPPYGGCPPCGLHICLHHQLQSVVSFNLLCIRPNIPSRPPYIPRSKLKGKKKLCLACCALLVFPDPIPACETPPVSLRVIPPKRGGFGL